MTSMSRLRSGNVPRRWISMKRGSAMSGSAFATAGLKRSVCPVASSAPPRSAAATSRSASSTLGAIGFSMSVATPASRNGIATSRCAIVGTATVTAFTRESKSAASTTCVPNFDAISSARG